MKKNKIALIIIVILVAFTIVLIVLKGKSNTFGGRDAEFAVTDTSNVTRIFLANLDSNQVLLERDGDGWKLDGNYRAQQKKVELLLTTLMKIKVRGPVSEASHENVLRRMSAIGIKVEIYQTVPRINLFGKLKWFPHEKLTRVYYVGDVTKDNLGTYMLREGADQAYILYIPDFRGFVASRYSPIADDWRDHSVFRKKIGEIQSIQLEFSEEPYMSYKLEKVDKNNYRITRIADQYVLPAYDTLRVLNFLTSFSDVRFEALLNNGMPASKRDSITNSPFLHKITLIDRDNHATIVKTYTKKKYAEHLDIAEKLVPVDLDRMYALVNDDKDFVLLQYFVFDKVLRPVLWFEKHN